jgi:hypothetical protein
MLILFVGVFCSRKNTTSLQRKTIMIELNPDYAEKGRARVAACQGPFLRPSPGGL